MKSWYIIHTKPRQEKKARLNLDRQGYTTYLPQLLIRKRRRGRYYDAIEPMFPGYMFIHLGREIDNWSPIRSTVGVASLVSFSNTPARAPDDLIAALKERENDQGINTGLTATLQKGARVKISSGPFAGYAAIFQSTLSRDRVLLLLNIAERHVRFQLNQDDIDID